MSTICIYNTSVAFLSKEANKYGKIYNRDMDTCIACAVLCGAAAQIYMITMMKVLHT